ncbi:MAG: CheR family methyltransferase [Cytophagales bacterium]|nr:CheR family methyltransferase [Cytophagales bacterium]
MVSTTNNTEISDQELIAINQVLMTKYGYDFSGYEPSSIKRRLSRIIHKFELDGILDLWRKLMSDYNFMLDFKDEISVGLTEMFRNTDLWIYLKNEYMPLLSHKDNIKIWHSGCSTGEEVWSMSILTHEVGIFHKCKAISTDLSNKFIEISKSATYDDHAMQVYNKNYLEYNPYGTLYQYFTPLQNNTYTIKNSLKTYSELYQHNLVYDPMPHTFDIIFCRNVMIYFNDSLKMKVLDSLHKSLSHDGIFIIGYFDNMPQEYGQYFEYYAPGYKIYKKIS